MADIKNEDSAVTYFAALDQAFERAGTQVAEAYASSPIHRVGLAKARIIRKRRWWNWIRKAVFRG